ncbi:hypothetical protein ABPG74_010467 [Tetrahymena malaccensis]
MQLKGVVKETIIQILNNQQLKKQRKVIIKKTNFLIMKIRQFLLIFLVICLFVCTSTSKKLKTRKDRQITNPLFKFTPGSVKQVVVYSRFKFQQITATQGSSLTEDQYNQFNQLLSCNNSISQKIELLGNQYTMDSCSSQTSSFSSESGLSLYVQIVTFYEILCTSNSQQDCQQVFNYLGHQVLNH